jgi:hypothetical protein
MTLRPLPVACAAFALLSAPVLGVTNPIVRKVIGQASAAAHTALPAGTTFSTGRRSRSEPGLGRAIARVGENADVQTTPGGLALRQGATLMASDPATFRRTVEVRAPGYRLKVKGTVQVSYEPGRAMKVVVLDGTATVALDSLAGEFETLQPGQLLVINPSDSRLPEFVEIDLNRLAPPASWWAGGFGALDIAPGAWATLGVRPDNPATGWSDYSLRTPARDPASTVPVWTPSPLVVLEPGELVEWRSLYSQGAGHGGYAGSV